MTTVEIEKQLKDAEKKASNRLKTINAALEKHTVSEAAIVRLRTQLAEAKAKESTLAISEHALLRYAERALGYDVEDAKRKIITPELVTQYKTLGNGEYPVGSVRAVVRNGKIVTVLKNLC